MQQQQQVDTNFKIAMKQLRNPLPKILLDQAKDMLLFAFLSTPVRDLDRAKGPRSEP